MSPTRAPARLPGSVPQSASRHPSTGIPNAWSRAARLSPQKPGGPPVDGHATSLSSSSAASAQVFAFSASGNVPTLYEAAVRSRRTDGGLIQVSMSGLGRERGEHCCRSNQAPVVRRAALAQPADQVLATRYNKKGPLFGQRPLSSHKHV
jgi:hypothetical protein